MGKLKMILVLYTGGTIGMQKNKNGVYAPVPKVFINKIKSFPELHNPELAKIHSLEENQLVMSTPFCSQEVSYEIEEYHPLLDSSNMSTAEWIRIAQDIEKNYNRYDGFVVLHGTDTLAYTSSVLSFMLENLEKPVILTGAQVPIFESPSDAKNNFSWSLIFASSCFLSEVCIYFSNRLLRGNRAKKVHSLQLDAFDSPNYHVLADTGMQMNIYRHFIRPKTGGPTLQAHTSLNPNVSVLFFFPTITTIQLESFLQPPLEGMVLQTYGAGNIPSRRADVLEVLGKAVKRGVVIVNITQCAQGSVSIAYETGKVLEDIGIINGHDMTVEAALTKLIVILGISDSYTDRSRMMRENLQGEMTLLCNN